MNFRVYFHSFSGFLQNIYVQFAGTVKALKMGKNKLKQTREKYKKTILQRFCNTAFIRIKIIAI